MSDAIHLRLTARARVVAAGIAIWLVACCLLAARHEAQTAHWFDRSGRALHAIHVADAHASDQAAIHRTAESPDLDACELVAALHAAASATASPPRLVAAAARASIVPIPRAAIVIARAAYRLAPKTSPPLAS